jgi:hypothetical protein
MPIFSTGMPIFLTGAGHQPKGSLRELQGGFEPYREVEDRQLMKN